MASKMPLVQETKNRASFRLGLGELSMCSFAGMMQHEIASGTGDGLENKSYIMLQIRFW